VNSSGAEERSLGALISDLLQDIRFLFSQELSLAKKELSEKVAGVAQSAVTIGIGAVLATGGLFVFMAALVLVLDLFMPAWVAALVLSLVFLAVGGLLVFLGIQKIRNTRVVPERTMRTVEEGVQRVKERVT
jgi:uncharacterized membrane protein YqjE